MATRRISDVIELSSNLHQSMQNILQQKVDIASTTRLSSAFEYLKSVEQKTKTVIDEIPETERNKVLSTYVRYYPKDEEDKARDIIENIDSDDVTSIMNSKIKMRQQLIDIYDLCATDAHIPEVKELMVSIRDIEATKHHEVSRQLSEYQLQR